MVKDNFFTGLRTILPLVLFIIILGWVFGTLFYWIECIELLFPERILTRIGLPDVVIKLLALFFICVVIWIIGIIANQPYMSKKFKSWLNPIIYRVPLLSHLFKINNQVESSLRNTDSFKKVVLVKTCPYGYEVGFITGENPKTFCKALKRPELISVVLPFSPLTSYRIILVKPEDIIEVDMSVSAALSYILSMGAAGGDKGDSKGVPLCFRVRLFLILNVLFFYFGIIYYIFGMNILSMIEFDMKRKSLTEKSKKVKNHFLTGLLAILPTVLFFVILAWLLSLILRRVGKIVELFPDAMTDKLLLPEIVVHFLGFLVLCGLIWLLGFIMNQGRIGERVKACLDPLIEKVPLLNSLTKITNQAANTLKNTNSFKKVILTRFPMEKTWSVGFLTGEDLEIFEKASGEMHLVSVFIPTTPNPTNGYLVLMNPRDFIETEVPVATAISFVISMGTAGAAKEIMKKSHSSLK